MKRIIFSGSLIIAVAALVTGVTIAFYNDTETSTGNIFTAGSIDLKVDHTKASYNGEECKTCHLEIVSDATTKVGSSPAVELSFVHSAWTADLDGGHVAGLNNGTTDGSKWIWITDGPTLPTTNQEYTFDRSFVWNGTASAATLYIATDNLYTSMVLNGNPIGSTANDNNFQLATEDVFVNLAPFLIQGTNVLQVTVRNIGLGGSTPTTNPAGLLFKLEIDGSCQGSQSGGGAYLNTPGATCELWGTQDLTSQQYFDFGDVKPGDHGTNLISLHVDDNDAYACLIPHDLNDQDNTVVDPELQLSDTGLVGELSGELEFFLWEDNGDGVYQILEPILAGPGTTIGQIQTEMVAMQLTGGGATEYVGLAWCAGTQTLVSGVISCDGNGMGDIAQTDSLLASLTAYAEQIRNNPNFSCAGVNLPTQGDGDGEALGPEKVDLLAANDFVIVAKTAITDANPSLSALTGNIAINPTAGSAITGVSCTSVLGGGKIYNDGGYTGGWNSNDACEMVAPATALAVRSAMETAYTDAAGRTGPDGTNLYAGNLGGQTFAPGLYKWTTGVTIPTDVTLSGDVNDVWIFQISGTLDIASGGSPAGGADVILAGGAQAKNVFWQVAGATTLGTYSTFNGTILDQTNIAIQTGAVLNGRALAQTAVTLDDNTVTLP